jgi:hypothetical protein
VLTPRLGKEQCSGYNAALGRRSSVVERLFCKQRVVSSNLTVGSHF